MAALQSSLHQMVLCFFGIWFAFWDAIICYVDDNIRKYCWIGSSALQIVSVQSSKAAWCENAAQVHVDLAKDGEGVSVVMTIW